MQMKPTISRGEELARGAGRHLRSRGFTYLEEFVPAPGLRVDLMGINPNGKLWIVECKSSRADYLSDKKWRCYLPFCDQFFFAVDKNFPHAILPDDTGLIIADPYDAEIIRFGPELTVSPVRRKSLTIKLAHNAADRHGLLKESLRNRNVFARR